MSDKCEDCEYVIEMKRQLGSGAPPLCAKHLAQDWHHLRSQLARANEVIAAADEALAALGDWRRLSSSCAAYEKSRETYSVEETTRERLFKGRVKMPGGEETPCENCGAPFAVHVGIALSCPLFYLNGEAFRKESGR